MTKYTPFEIQHSSYRYDPNFAANVTALVIFAIILALQLVLGLWKRQWWFLVTWGCTGILEVLGYVGRVIAHGDIFDASIFKMQLVCLVLAPAFMAAGIYFQLAKIITVYGERFSPLAPMTYCTIFIVCDVVSIFVQAAGGGVATSNNENTSKIGAWVMVGSIGFQVGSLSVFIVLMSIVMARIYKARGNAATSYDQTFAHIRQRRFFPYLGPCAYISSVFVLIRSIYRVIELSQGWHGHLITTEVYVLVLDGLMILLGMIPLTVFHPGICLGTEVLPVRGLHYKGPKGKDAKVDDTFVESY